MNSFRLHLALILSIILIYVAAAGDSVLSVGGGKLSFQPAAKASAYQFDGKDKYSRSRLASPTTAIAPKKSPPETQQGKRIVGYYAAWASYSGFTPDKIDASRLTHINYAFARISNDLKITMGYPDRDPLNFKMLNDLKKKNPNLKTLISVGGWTWSGRFSDAALTSASREVFADSCVAFIKKHGFDGVDIDWEYPVGGGLAGNGNRASDKQNFTLLLKTLREKLDAQSAADGKQYLLTIAAGAGSSYARNTELSKLHVYLDYATIMTYDLHGTWDRYTDLLAPLYSNSDPSPQYKASVDSSIKIWNNASFPAEKLVLGIPFYGYLYSTTDNKNDGLYQRFSDGKSIAYHKIAKDYLNKNGFSRYFHKQSKVPWLFNGSVYITYEDAESIGYKAAYVKDSGLGGAMIWELSQDYDGILLNSLYKGLYEE